LSAAEPPEAALSPVELLSRSHDLSAFDCGKHPSLNDWLTRFAFANQQNETSRTYVVHRAQRVVGYYSIATGSVLRGSVPARIGKGIANHPIPILLLTRLAVEQNEQGRGLGKALLKDALRRMARAADIVAARAVVVHAIDSSAADFYRRFNFEPMPGNDLHLILLMKDLRAAVRD
jgi:GNAT superfamily N-acetyltransferase